MTVKSNKVNISVMAPTEALKFYNYEVSYLCNFSVLDVHAFVLYNNDPVPFVDVDVGFCSAFDFNNKQFTGEYTATKTGIDGSFVVDYKKDTLPLLGSSICIVAMVQYKNQTAVAYKTITLPRCSYPTSPIGQYVIIEGKEYPYQYTSTIPTNTVLTEYTYPFDFFPDFCIYYTGDKVPKGWYCASNGDLDNANSQILTDNKGDWWGIIAIKTPWNYMPAGVYEFNISWSGSTTPL